MLFCGKNQQVTLNVVNKLPVTAAQCESSILDGVRCHGGVGKYEGIIGDLKLGGEGGIGVHCDTITVWCSSSSSGRWWWCERKGGESKLPSCPHSMGSDTQRGTHFFNGGVVGGGKNYPHSPHLG